MYVRWGSVGLALTYAVARWGKGLWLGGIEDFAWLVVLAGGVLWLLAWPLSGRRYMLAPTALVFCWLLLVFIALPILALAIPGPENCERFTWLALPIAAGLLALRWWGMAPRRGKA
jgi:hypothetical protein